MSLLLKSFRPNLRQCHHISIFQKNYGVKVEGKWDDFDRVGQAELYAAFRPRYTQSVVHSLLSRVSDRETALDVACGSGQLTMVSPISFYSVRMTAWCAVAGSPF